jgi:prepilin-type N-terminal cleavage/methylation domain-containing protein
MFPLKHRKLHGFALIEILSAVVVSAILLTVGLAAIPAWQKQQQAAQRPVEMGKIVAASRAFLKDTLRLPDLSQQEDRALWASYYKPPSNLTSEANQALPDGFRYQIVRAYSPSGLTTDDVPGEIKVTGTTCDQPSSDPQAFCDVIVPF